MHSRWRLINLAVSVPWMLFLAFPISYAFSWPTEQRVGIIAGCALIGITNLAVWALAPRTPRPRITPTFAISHSLLIISTLAYCAYATHIGLPWAFMMVSFPLTAWVLQAPVHLIWPGGATLLWVAFIVVWMQEEPLFVGVYMLLPTMFAFYARRSMERRQREQVAHEEAMLAAREQERSRLSADLHDILGHSLTALTMQSELAGRLLDAGRAEAARAQIAQITASSREALADVRAIVSANRALSPEEELASARALLDIAGIEVRIHEAGVPSAGPRSVLAAHVIREGVTNVIAHSRASWVDITVSARGVRIVNDGYSERLSRDSVGSGSGLEALRERAESEGTLTWGPSGSRWWVALDFVEVEL